MSKLTAYGIAAFLVWLFLPLGPTHDAPSSTTTTTEPRTIPQFPSEAPEVAPPPSGPAPVSPPNTAAASDLSPTESARLDDYDGSGDVPFGDGPDDGRFRDVECDTFDDQGMTCRYGDGVIAAQDINYHDGAWWWGTTNIGACAAEDACTVVWDNATTSPEVSQ